MGKVVKSVSMEEDIVVSNPGKNSCVVFNYLKTYHSCQALAHWKDQCPVFQSKAKTDGDGSASVSKGFPALFSSSVNSNCENLQNKKEHFTPFITDGYVLLRGSEVCEPVKILICF